MQALARGRAGTRPLQKLFKGDADPCAGLFRGRAGTCAGKGTCAAKAV